MTLNTSKTKEMIHSNIDPMHITSLSTPAGSIALFAIVPMFLKIG